MDFHSHLMDESSTPPSLISFSTEASEDHDAFLDELNHLNLSNDGNHQVNEDNMEQKNNHIKRLEKRIRYLEMKYVECKKENKVLKSYVQQHRIDNDGNNDHKRSNEQEKNKFLIGSQATSLRVLHDLVNIINGSKEDETTNPSQSGLMDLVRSLHYLSLELGTSRTEEETANRSFN
jgi:hypothetical protein